VGPTWHIIRPILMMITLRARSTPYRPALRACDRICKRCGIQFMINPQRDRHHTECRDCR
jgi:hypothetical protein